MFVESIVENIFKEDQRRLTGNGNKKQHKFNKEVLSTIEEALENMDNEKVKRVNKCLEW